jgi:hypothetical protein
MTVGVDPGEDADLLADGPLDWKAPAVDFWQDPFDDNAVA